MTSASTGCEASVEKVGVIDRSVARSLDLLRHGFTPLRALSLLEDIERALYFVARPEAEIDPSRKQIIPYGLLLRDDRVFVMKRLPGSGERRLRGKLSLGVGGHINSGDNSTGGLIESSFRRELAEELDLTGRVRIVPCGLINDDSQPVGAVHLGIVHRVELLLDGRVKVRETDALSGAFMPWDRVVTMVPRMETWSSLLVGAHGAGLLGA